MWKNMISAGFRGDAYKIALYKASNATAFDCFDLAMKELEALDPKVVEWLENKPPSQWSKAHFSTRSMCDMTLNNGCESFNSMLRKAREQGILTMLEMIRECLTKRLQKNRDEANEKWKGLICPEAKNILEKNMDKVRLCSIIMCDDCHFQVSTVSNLQKFQYNASFVDNTCTCRKWQMTGIPCTHALQAIGTLCLDPVEFVHPLYRIETYKRVYAPAIYGINGAGLWTETCYIPPLPPAIGKRAGRPCKARKKGQDEPQRRKKDASTIGTHVQPKRRRMQSSLKCSFCGLVGHNIKTCQLKQSKKIEKEQQELHDEDQAFLDAFSFVVQNESEGASASNDVLNEDHAFPPAVKDNFEVAASSNELQDVEFTLESSSMQNRFGDPSEFQIRTKKFQVTKKNATMATNTEQTYTQHSLQRHVVLPPIMSNSSSNEMSCEKHYAQEQNILRNHLCMFVDLYLHNKLDKEQVA